MNYSFIDIAANISKQGTIYCAAFANFGAPNTLWDIFAQGFSSNRNSAGICGVHITGLYLDTGYSIYCYTTDFNGHSMPLIVAMETKVSIRTACCKKIICTASVTLITQNTTISSGIITPQFTIGLNSPPSSLLTLHL